MFLQKIHKCFETLGELFFHKNTKKFIVSKRKFVFAKMRKRQLSFLIASSSNSIYPDNCMILSNVMARDLKTDFERVLARGRVDQERCRTAAGNLV
jgi:hypothetical protein